MKNYGIFTSLALSIFFLSGCFPQGMTPEEFINSSDGVSLTINGQQVMTYKEGTHQIGYNDEEVQFRVSDDRFSNFFAVKCVDVPKEQGQTIEALLTYTTDNDILEKLCNFTVSKIDGDMVWLWDGKKKIGAVVRLLR